MSTDRDVTRTVRSWLEEGVTALPDRVLDDVLDQIPATPQRRAPWWPAWRLPPMSNTARLALAAAAVVVVAFLGFRYLLPANVGDPGETPVPTTVSSPQALPAVGALEPGTYVINEEPNTTAHPYTLTVPAGWNTDDGFVTKGDSGAADEPDVFVTSWIVTHVFADACLWTTAQADSLVEARTPAEIVDALANQAGHETAGPTAVTVDGYPAQRLEFNVPDTFDIAACNESFLRLWPDPGPNFSGGLPTDVGQRTVIYVVDIDGDAAVIIGASMSDATSTDVAEMQAVLASIQFSEASP